MPSIAQASSSSEVPPLTLTAPMMLLSPIEAPPPPLSKESKRRWSYFIRKVYETDPLVCHKWVQALPQIHIGPPFLFFQRL